MTSTTNNGFIRFRIIDEVPAEHSNYRNLLLSNAAKGMGSTTVELEKVNMERLNKVVAEMFSLEYRAFEPVLYAVVCFADLYSSEAELFATRIGSFNISELLGMVLSLPKDSRWILVLPTESDSIRRQLPLGYITLSQRSKSDDVLLTEERERVAAEHSAVEQRLAKKRRANDIFSGRPVQQNRTFHSLPTCMSMLNKAAVLSWRHLQSRQSLLTAFSTSLNVGLRVIDAVRAAALKAVPRMSAIRVSDSSTEFQETQVQGDHVHIDGTAFLNVMLKGSFLFISAGSIAFAARKNPPKNDLKDRRPLGVDEHSTYWTLTTGETETAGMLCNDRQLRTDLDEFLRDAQNFPSDTILAISEPWATVSESDGGSEFDSISIVESTSSADFPLNIPSGDSSWDIDPSVQRQAIEEREFNPYYPGDVKRLMRNLFSKFAVIQHGGSRVVTVSEFMFSEEWNAEVVDDEGLGFFIHCSCSPEKVKCDFSSAHVIVDHVFSQKHCALPAVTRSSTETRKRSQDILSFMSPRG